MNKAWGNLAHSKRLVAIRYGEFCIKQLGFLGIRNSRWVVPAGFIFLSLLAVSLIRFMTPVWLVNDDQVEADLASGRYSGTPESHLVFIKQTIGLPLSFAYSSAPTIPWYAISLVTTIILSLALLLRFARNLQNYLMWFAIAVPTTVFCVLRPNFTIASIIASTVGLVLLSFALTQGKWRCSAGLSFILIIVGYSWRADGFFLALLFCSPIILIACYKIILHGGWTRLRLILVALIPVSLLLITGLDTACVQGISCQAWETFYEYNLLHVSFNASPRGEFLLRAIAPDLGWSPEMYRMFQISGYGDNSIFGIETMRTANSQLPLVFSLGENSFMAWVLDNFSKVWSYAALLIVGFGATIVPTLMTTALRKKFIAICCIQIFAWFSALSITSLIRLPDAILVGSIFSLLLLLVAWSFIYTDAPNNSPALKKMALASASVFALLSVILSIWGSLGFIRQSSIGTSITQHNATVRAQFDVITQGNPVFAIGFATDFFALGPYETSSGPDLFGPLTSGWPVFSPAFEARKSLLGFTPGYDVYYDLASTASLKSNRLNKEFLFVGTEADANMTAEIMRSVVPTHPNLVVQNMGTMDGFLYVWRFAPLVGPTATSP